MESAFLAALLLAQDPDAVSQKEVDAAIRKGVEYLKTAPSGADWVHPNCDELILLTLVAAGMPETHPVFDRYLRKCLAAPLERTYKAACLAMALEELDPSYYQMKLAQCAQFLLDNQAKNGQWSYGVPTDVTNFEFVEGRRTGTRPGGVVDFEAGPRERKKPARAVVVSQRRTRYDVGDNSNSQYAALGLRACHDANLRMPLQVIQAARDWWRDSQWPDESGARAGKAAVASGGLAPAIQGWSYQRPGVGDQTAPTRGMTAGALGARVIYDSMLGLDWKKDPVVEAGARWLGKHFVASPSMYYLYAVERAGMLYGTARFGDHDWYWKGAKVLVRGQNADGSWGRDEKAEKNTWDTCFAVLFLKKATRAIATGGRR